MDQWLVKTSTRHSDDSGSPDSTDTCSHAAAAVAAAACRAEHIDVINSRTESDSNESLGNTGVTNGKPDVSVTLEKFSKTMYLGAGRTLIFVLKRHKNKLQFSKGAYLLEITM
jgi:hypothetical protein